MKEQHYVTLLICPTCNKIMSYNSYFGTYYCYNCGYLGTDPYPNN